MDTYAILDKPVNITKACCHKLLSVGRKPAYTLLYRLTALRTDNLHDTLVGQCRLAILEYTRDLLCVCSEIRKYLILLCSRREGYIVGYKLKFLWMFPADLYKDLGRVVCIPESSVKRNILFDTKLIHSSFKTDPVMRIFVKGKSEKLLNIKVLNRAVV